MVSVASRRFSPLLKLARASFGGFRAVVLTAVWLASVLAAGLATPAYAQALPVVTGINPSSGLASGGTVVNVDGENFTPGSDVLFGGVSASSVTFVNSNSLVATAPPDSFGGNVGVEVTVANENGSSIPSPSYNTTFYYYEVPVVDSLSPSSGTGGIRVDIHGQNFTESSQVAFGGTTVFTNFVDSGDLWVFAPSLDNGAAVDVVVTTEGGTSQTGPNSLFTYFSAPTIESLTPGAGGSGTVVTIIGTGFTDTSQVTFNSVDASSITYVSDTELQATVPYGIAGDQSVVVTTEAGSSAPAAFTAIGEPVIGWTSPDAGQPGTVITISGDNFTEGAQVTVAGVAADSVTFVDSTQLQVVAPEASPGVSGPIAVTTAGGSVQSTTTFTYAYPPVVTSLDPASGPAGAVIQVHGSHFQNVQSATINGVWAYAVALSDDVIQLQLPDNATTGHVIIQTDGGTSAVTAADVYTVLQPPVVSSLSQSSGTQQGGDTVVLTGENFTGVDSVRFGDKDAASFTVDSDTQITAVTPADFAWSVEITVHNAIGWSQGVSWTYVASPEIESISPQSGSPSGGTTVAIQGMHLENVTSVKFGATPAASFQVVSPSEVDAVSPAGTGQVDVSVADAYSSNLPSSAAQFTYSGTPEVTAVSPNAAPIAGGTTVTLTGSSFTGATAVKFGSTAATFTVVSDTQITATVPAVSAAGNVNVTVTTPDGVSAATSYNAFVYVAAPTVTSVSPNSGSNTGGGQVTITGTGFSRVTAVKFGSTQASYYVASPTQITAAIPQDSGLLGQKDVTVTNLAGTSATNAGDKFTFTQGVSVTSVSPNSGPKSGGTEVTLTGTGFTGVTQVTFFGVPAQSFTVVSPTEITAVTPAAEYPGDAAVVVSAQSGETDVTHSGHFTYVEPPYPYAITPTAGPTSGGTSVEIQGYYFTGATAVMFGDTPAASFTVDSDEKITAVSPPGTAGAVNVQITATGGTSDHELNFTYADGPAVTAVSPSGGPLGGGQTVTLTGVGFTNASAVSFGGVAATSFTVDSDTQITAVSPAGSAGIVNVTVTTPDGTTAAGALNQYEYVGAPTVTSVSPDVAPRNPSTLVTIRGTGFTSNSGVRFGTQASNNVSFISSTELRAWTPPLTVSDHAVTVDVIVTTDAGESAPNDADKFVFDEAPTILDFTPGGGSPAGGTTVQITGAYLENVTSVKFGNVAATSFTIVDSTHITAVSPAGTGAVAITLTSPRGQGSTGTTYVYTENYGQLNPQTLPGGAVGADYSQQLSVGGRSGQMTFSVTDGQLPPGLALNMATQSTATLSGAPTTAGDYTFTITADELGWGTYSRTYTLSVAAAPSVAIGPATLANGTTQTAYSQTLTASGGQTPYVFTLASGALPAGLTLSSAGVISGTPTTAGTSNFTVHVADSGSLSADKDFSLTITQGEPAATSKAVTVNVTPGSPGSEIDLSDAVTNASGIEIVRQPEHGTLTVSGFVVTYTPQPGYFGTDSFDFVALPVSDGGNGLRMRTLSAQSDAATVTITIAAPTLALTPAELPQAHLDQAFSQTLTATGGTAPYTFAVTAGALPAGMTLSAEGVLSGTPAAAGPASFTVTATDSSTGTGPFTVSRSYTLQVSSVPITAPPIQVSTLQGRPVTVSLTEGASGGPYTAATLVSLSPSDAGQVTIDGTDGGGFALTFTSSGNFSGQATATYTISNASGASAPGTVTITVEARPNPARDPDVRGLIAAQSDAALRFADVQIGNFGQRLERLHSGAGGGFDNGIGLTFGFEDARLTQPWLQEQLDRERLPGLPPRTAMGSSAVARSTVTNAGPTGSGSGSEPGRISVWTGGSIQFGQRSPDGGPKFDFSTAGLSLGADGRLSDRLTLGVGLGVGESSADVGSDGSKVDGRYSMGAVYGSLRPTDGAFVDGMLGYGKLDFDSRRTVTPGVFGPELMVARGSRNGDQLIASVTTGWDLKSGELRVSPYGRLSSVTGSLDAFIETGAALANLGYEKQEFRSLKLAIGARAERGFEVDGGILTPRARFEYQHEFKGSDAAGVSYADWMNGPTYKVFTDLFDHDQVSVGIGAQYVRRRMSFSLDYQGMFAGDYSSQISGQASLEF